MQVTLQTLLVFSFPICEMRGLSPRSPTSALFHNRSHSCLYLFATTLVQSSVWLRVFSDITPCPKHNVDSYMGSRDVLGNTVHRKGGNDHFKRMREDFFCVLHIEQVIIGLKTRNLSFFFARPLIAAFQKCFLTQNLTNKELPFSECLLHAKNCAKCFSWMISFNSPDSSMK